MRAADQLGALAQGKIDVAFVGLSGPTEDPKLQYRVVASYPAVALLARTNRLESKSAVKLKDLQRCSSSSYQTTAIRAMVGG